MGFGLLFFGYPLLLDRLLLLNEEYSIGIDVIPDIIGIVLIFLALRKLTPYSFGFKGAKYLCYPLMLLGAAFVILPLLSFTGRGLSTISLMLDYAYDAKYVCLFFFNVLLFVGIRELALEVELPKIARRSVIAIILYALFFIPKICTYFIPMNDGQLAFLTLSYSLVWYASVFFTLFLFASCYVFICYEGEEEPEVKESRITSFLNKLKKK